MSIVNYSNPFSATPSPLGSSPYYSSRLDANPYVYTKPANPFLREDLAGGSRNYPPPVQPKIQPYSPNLPQQPQAKQPLSQAPTQPPGFTKVHGGAEDGVSRVHAVLDYDDPDYYDDGEEHDNPLHVTPIQGPIYVKNGSVPVVPLYSYPTVNNGTFVQIPILWTALSVALGLQIRGDYIRGVPCIKKYGQLFCPTAGNSYPLERIETFIDENKALMRRMYGDFTMGEEFTGGTKRKRSVGKPPGVPDLHADPGPDPVVMGGDSFFEKFTRKPRQNFRANQTSETGRVDACESKVEIVTPYWASNSAGKVRAIVNTQHFEQAIHQEVCSQARTKRCTNDCGCEQKYKWHRLLAYDPDNDCKGIFMDWFLFPSCCVCRCNP